MEVACMPKKLEFDMIFNMFKLILFLKNASSI